MDMNNQAMKSVRKLIHQRSGGVYLREKTKENDIVDYKPTGINKKFKAFPVTNA